jgi:8-oxo-dGTP diphosphatase
MALLLKIRDEDIGLKSRPYSKKNIRIAARAVIFDKNNRNKIALLHGTKYKYYKLPGGGVEKGESIDKALIRECLEETGCSIQVIRKLGIITEYRSKWSLINKSHCFLAEVKTIGKPHYTRSETAEGFKLVWVPADKALRLIEDSSPEVYDGKFMVLRDTNILKEALHNM